MGSATQPMGMRRGVAPSARGLFRRAIAQSVPGTFLSVSLAKDIAGAIAGELGLRPTVADLAGVAPDKLGLLLICEYFLGA